ncbi:MULTISPECIES: SDR family oxidoreductase [Bacillaceae]|uniref:Gluconate 5-dehydrogenase n=1 Tax=Peribacillus huizhouensis TaxID=1501239 RepID=A0ABR6CQX8_9BACI|nr:MULTISPECIES: SDR family oxidoreductase [Bacillaceae]MBA9027111.1 gluconate 5-dehydrogenase [Peribacillus huizhouensis]
MNRFDLTGKSAIITGGGRGLGLQIASALAEAGANIVIASRDITACEAAKEELSKIGVKVLAFQCDITKKADIDHVVSETVAEFGSIDILVNNSGTSWVSPVLDLKEHQWQKVMDVNITGTFLFSQAVAAVMIKQHSGKIINIASVNGFGGTAPELLDTIAYNTSKGAVITFTKDLGVKLARHGIQVNAIAPGFFPTKITQKIIEQTNFDILGNMPAGRFGNQEDLKGAAIFLASRASDYMIGHILVVDGGISALV